MIVHRIKIVHLISSRPEGFYGGDLVILNLLKCLDNSKFEPWIVSFQEARRPGIPLLIKTARHQGIKTFLIDSKGKFDVRPIRQLRQFIFDNQINILHCHGYKADIIGFLALRGTGIKRITTLHGWWPGKSLKLKLYNFLDYYAINNFDKIIVVSEQIKTLLIKKNFSLDKIVYIPNSADLKQVQSSDSYRVKKELNFDKGTLIVGTAGRLSKEKGYRYLLSAIKDIPNAALLILGSGPLQKQLAKLSGTLKIKERVIFAGFRQNIHDFIAAMDIFVLPSLSEGLPLALLEAMAAQKPVIASNIGGIPTVIKNGETGILVEPRKPDLLKKAIINLSNDKELANRIAINARKLIEQTFSTELMAKKYEAVYSEISED